MSDIKAGLVAGFSATVVLSAAMLGKSMMGVMPELDVIQMLGSMMGVPPVFGWLAHFMIGTIAWGVGFAILNGAIPGPGAWQKGILFGIAAWLGMMIAVMPMAGAGLFGMAFGLMAPMMTLLLHVIFGAVLGAVYQALARPAVA
jgi:hypothetical protein